MLTARVGGTIEPESLMQRCTVNAAYHLLDGVVPRHLLIDTVIGIDQIKVFQRRRKKGRLHSVGVCRRLAAGECLLRIPEGQSVERSSTHEGKEGCGVALAAGAGIQRKDGAARPGILGRGLPEIPQQRHALRNGQLFMQAVDPLRNIQGAAAAIHIGKCFFKCGGVVGPAVPNCAEIMDFRFRGRPIGIGIRGYNNPQLI